MEEIQHFQCSCIRHEHVIRFDFHPDDKEIFIGMFMDNYIPWYKRIIVAINYVLKRNCSSFSSSSHWDCILLSVDMAKELRDQLSNFIYLSDVKRKNLS